MYTINNPPPSSPKENLFHKILYSFKKKIEEHIINLSLQIIASIVAGIVLLYATIYISQKNQAQPPNTPQKYNTNPNSDITPESKPKYPSVPQFSPSAKPDPKPQISFIPKPPKPVKKYIPIPKNQLTSKTPQRPNHQPINTDGNQQSSFEPQIITEDDL